MHAHSRPGARPIGRRSLIRGVGALGVAAALSGCGTGDGGSSSRSRTGSGVLPSYHPFTDVEPDLPAGENGIPAGFLRYPDPPKELGDIPLSERAPISMLLQGKALGVPPAKNRHFAQLEKDAGTSLEMRLGDFVSYTDVFQVTIAGNDLPDLVQIDTGAPQLARLLDSKFTDLTDVLGKDAVERYPGLASIPTEAWRVCQLNGRLWGIPQARPPGGHVVSTRGDLMRDRGLPVSPEIADGREFIALLKELTSPSENRFALGADPVGWLLPALLEMYGAPNGWRADGDSFVHAWETDMMKDALGTAQRIWKDGYLHPNSFSDAGSNFEWWSAGTTTLYMQSFSGWGEYDQQYPAWDLGVVTLPKWEGGGRATKHLGDAAYGAFVAISRQREDARLEEILEFVDYLSAPFGTREFLRVNHGLPDLHYTLRDGDPIPTERSIEEVVRPMQYVGSKLKSVLYVAGNPTSVERQHEFLRTVLPEGERDATTGLYSETAATDGASAAVDVQDAQAEIVQGRRSLKEWDDIVDQWRRRAGDRTRQEYEEAAAATR